MADRYAAFLPSPHRRDRRLAWALSGDAVRALAVFVVATPCPCSSWPRPSRSSRASRCAARAGVIVKGAPDIERLGDTRTVLLDKTGTLTIGTPAVER